MRIDTHKERNEIRDSIDRNWYSFLSACGLSPILIPNVENFLSIFNIVHGVVLTGGNTLGVLGGDALDRDNLESALLNYCILHKKPLLGVCRGMQVIQDHFGVNLRKVKGHVKVRHNVQYKGRGMVVNSYHEYAAYDSNEDLIIEARADDDVVEAVSHRYYPLKGIMWHPEREISFSQNDVKLFKEHFYS